MKRTKRVGKSKSGKKSKKAAKSTKKVELNPEATRQDIARIVQLAATEIASAVVQQAKSGQLAPAKFLMEVGGIYPPVTDGSLSVSAREESLAETLLNRLNIPTTPVNLEEEEEPVILPPLVKREDTVEEDSEELAGVGSEG